MVPRNFRLGAAFLAIGALFAALYYVFPAGGTAEAAIYDSIGGVALIAIVWGIRANRPDYLLPWIVFALGNAFFVAGDSAFDLNPNAATPSLSDYFYLTAYPLFALAVLLLVLRSERGRFGASVDAGVVTLAFAVFQWLFVIDPAVHGSAPLGQKVVDGLYPAMDIVLLGGFVGFFSSPAWRTPAFTLLVAGFVTQLVGDEAVGLSSSGYQEGSWVDVMWMFSYLLWGAAVLHPSMRELSRPRHASAVSVSRARIAVLAGALLIVPAALSVAHARGQRIGIYEVSALAAAIALLVIGRLNGILRTLERIRMRERNARWLAEDTQKLLAEQNERLVEADRLKDEFVALISHDLRTPLTSIIGYVELALDEGLEPKLDEERAAYLEVVSRNAERLVRLVDDLLFVARLQAGRLVLDPGEIDLAALAAEAVDEARPRAEQAGLAISFAGASPLPVEADRGRLLQLLDNLISNAIKFTPPGGRVDVRTTNGAGSAVLEVSDTGMGIAPGESEKIFERFFRAGHAVAEQVPGTGLGLFIARAIADAHGGRISAESRGGGGTTFRIELPLLDASEPVGTEELVV